MLERLDTTEGYAPPGERPPLGSYPVAMAIFNALFATPSELEESSRGTGPRKAIGEMLLCPYCLGLWVISAFVAGLLFVPRAQRRPRRRRRLAAGSPQHPAPRLPRRARGRDHGPRPAA
jgi:hypothetical protein